MQSFVVISTGSEASELERTIRETYEGAHQDVSPSVWLVADRGATADEVCRKLGVKRTNPPSPGLDGVIVLRFDDYFGHAPKSVWNWIADKQLVDDGRS